MEIDIDHSEYRRQTIVKIRIPDCDYLAAKITKSDRMLFHECEASDKVSDKLLGLETLARRIEESNE